jgi:hypothetical protein
METKVARSVSVPVDEGQFARPKIKIIHDDETKTKSVLKWFATTDGSVFLTGDAEDHELWKVEDTKATLIGVLSQGCFKAMMRLRKGSVLSLECTPKNFEWFNTIFKQRIFLGKGLSVTDLKVPPLVRYDGILGNDIPTLWSRRQ